MEERSDSITSDDPHWLEQLAEAAVPAAAPVEAPVYLPALDRERPQRAPLIPRAVWMGGLTVSLLLAAIVGIFFWVRTQGLISTPSVVGSSEGDARVVASRAGLTFVVDERRFSTAPEGQVIEQHPAPGTEVRRGDQLRVVLSAGTEEFTLPDVIGQGLSLALGTLEAKGLFVDTVFVLSDAASDTVLSSMPAPGSIVRTGDRVRLEVSSPRDASVGLRPYRLDGVVVVIDPQPPVPGLTNDPALEVSRRLRALLEASGAVVRLLRTGADSSTVDADRAARARESTYTVGVGLSVTAGSGSGMAVSTATSLAASAPTSSTALASALERTLTDPTPPRRADVAFDNVFGASENLWVRVTLGSASSRDDITSFIDPRWADKVARAVYTALAESFGTPELP